METSEKKIKKSVTRIALNESSRRILSEWKSNLEKQFPGINISFAELVGWAIEKIGPELSKREQSLIRDRFFDEMKQLEWFTKRLREAKSKGEPLSLAQLMRTGAKAETPSNGKRTRQEIVPD